LLREPDGKPKYGQSDIAFANHGVRSRWSDSVLAAVNEHDPNILSLAEGPPLLPFDDAGDVP
jgi:hypothetical protein